MSSAQHVVQVGNLRISNDLPMTVIAGPCQLESLDHALRIAEETAEACAANNTGFIFKGSFDKANRTSLSGERGVGIDRGLEILAEVRARVGCPVLSDVHTPDQCEIAAQYLDVLQIPAFLCRQTDLLLAAGETGKAVNVKKGQFLAPWDMEHVIAKIASTGNTGILQCERGSSFGYNTLISDMRAIPQMARSGYPVVMDATHSIQQPGGRGDASGGQREFAQVMARAAVSVGVAAVFIETHEAPDSAPSDGPNMVRLDQLPALIKTLKRFDKIAKEEPVNI